MGKARATPSSRFTRKPRAADLKTRAVHFVNLQSLAEQWQTTTKRWACGVKSIIGTIILPSGYVMNKKLKSIPKFSSEAEERRFWETHDSGDYIDWSKAERVRLPNLEPSTTAISLRLPVTLLERIKVAANKRDVPYQSLIKIWLAEKTATR